MGRCAMRCEVRCGGVIGDGGNIGDGDSEDGQEWMVGDVRWRWGRCEV